MAASMPAVVFLLFLASTSVYTVNCRLEELKPAQILRKIEEGCVFILLSPENEILWNSFVELVVAFPTTTRVRANNDGPSSATSLDVNYGKSNAVDDRLATDGPISRVTIGYHEGPFVWNDHDPLIWKNQDDSGDYSPSIAFFKRRPTDRTCLFNVPHTKPKAGVYDAGDDVGSMITFSNSKCNAFQTAEGLLSPAGEYRKHILNNLFHVSEITNVTMGTIWQGRRELSAAKVKSDCHGSTHQGFCRSVNQDFDGEYIHDFTQVQNDLLAGGQGEVQMAQCERLSQPITKEQFFHQYLTQSKPVILEGAVKHWRAFTKWTKEFLHNKYGNEEVHIKLAPNGIFEGVEDIHLWEDHKNFMIPPEVHNQLPFPDLVVVRPGTAHIKFSDFLKMMENGGLSETCHVNQTRVSAYMEYSSVRNYFEDLEEDLEESEMLSEYLQLKHLNIWISDGNTLGKLHFDPYDNLLCQIRGKKQLTLFEPHQNTQLYEAHIQEALLGYSKSSKTFRRKTLLDSTSMVMAPVNILNPDFQRFPEFAKVKPLNCTIDEGDALFLPSFWWHEVQSYPNESEGRNLAINYWYKPFLQKEFPCQECTLDVNPDYRHLLRRYS